ncbi:MAG: RNase adaptor protein RapZ, partial [Ruminiclostridium sp.]|nr:RNase adaptor protein RapZ [Ruminiclostridium sp.]
LNSTGLNLSKFRGELLRLFGMATPSESISISVTSFGFKHGIPRDADLVFDARFLPNPYYIPELKECSGLEEPVRTFLFGYRQTHEFLRHLEDLFSFLLPQYVEEGKSSLVIAIGCTGGHHRSVAIAHAVTEFIRQKGYRVEEQHRDINR